jgi:hypothetical protein
MVPAGCQAALIKPRDGMIPQKLPESRVCAFTGFFAANMFIPRMRLNT